MYAKHQYIKKKTQQSKSLSIILEKKIDNLNSFQESLHTFSNVLLGQASESIYIK